MSGRKAVQEAEIAETLVWVDGPRLITLTSGPSKLLAIALPSQGSELPFAAVRLDEDAWSGFVEGQTDLRSLFQGSDPADRFSFDLNEYVDDRVRLAACPDGVPDDCLPAAGISIYPATNPAV